MESDRLRQSESDPGPWEKDDKPDDERTGVVREQTKDSREVEKEGRKSPDDIENEGGKEED